MANGITRWNDYPVVDDSNQWESEMRSEPEGEYVSHTDHLAEVQRLQTELDAAKKVLASAEAALEAQEKKYEDCPHPKGPEYWPCACSYDNINDVCMVHSPPLKEALARLNALRETVGKDREDFLDLLEYWNGNEGSSVNACEHAQDIARAALARHAAGREEGNNDK